MILMNRITSKGFLDLTYEEKLQKIRDVRTLRFSNIQSDLLRAKTKATRTKKEPKAKKLTGKTSVNKLETMLGKLTPEQLTAMAKLYGVKL